MKQGIMGLTLGTVMLSVTGIAHAALKTNFDGCTPENTFFFAYTKTHTKAVEFCEMPNGYRYTFGPINQPEMQVTKKPGEIGRYLGREGWNYVAENGDARYWIDSTMREISLMVTVNDKVVAFIPLETTRWGYINQIGQYDIAKFEY